MTEAEFLIGPDALEATLDSIDLTGCDHSEIAQAFDSFFSTCDRSIQELLLATLANVMGIDAMWEVPLPDHIANAIPSQIA